MELEFTFDLIELAKKMSNHSPESTLMNMAVFVEKRMIEMEEKGEKITRESFHKAIKEFIKKCDDMEKAA